MDTLKGYEKRGFSGIDTSLEISIFEYGLIWAQDGEDEYKFIYGIEKGENEEGEFKFVKFGWGNLSKKDFSAMAHEEWFDLPAVLKFMGIDNEAEFLDNFPFCVLSAIDYHGAENILGIEYNPFEIKKD